MTNVALLGTGHLGAAIARHVIELVKIKTFADAGVLVTGRNHRRPGLPPTESRYGHEVGAFLGGSRTPGRR